MHILMLSDVYFPRVNGVSTSIQSFSRSLLAFGHSTTLIAPEYPSAFQAEFEVIRIPSKRLLFDPEDRVMSLRALKRLVPTLKKRPFDIVHIHTPFIGHYAGVRLAKVLGVKTVTTYHTFFEAYLEAYLPKVPKSWLRYLARTYSKKQCNQVDGVVSPSSEMLKRLRAYGVTRRATVIPTGLPPEVFCSFGEQNFRERYDLPEDAYLLLYVGRVAYEKNVEFLLSVIDRVRLKVPKALLLIAGEGPALNDLKQRVNKRGLDGWVRFTGYLDRATELPACYQAADIFVFASQTETQGLVLLEAMASGLPVVSTASMGSRDVLRDGEGCLVSPLNVTEFADRVIAVYDDGCRAKELSRRAVAYASQWRMESKAKELLAFYEQVIEEGGCDEYRA